MISIKHKQTATFALRVIMQVLATISLVFVLLTPTVNAQERFYAKVHMDVPRGSHLIQVLGVITPKPSGVAINFVAYSVFVAFTAGGDPISYQWIEGGYYTDAERGTVFYIGWRYPGEYYQEITATGVSFGEQYYVMVYDCRHVGDGESPQVGWTVSIYDMDNNLKLRKNCPNLTNNDLSGIWAVAGGESTDPYNRMNASFSWLEWTTFDPRKGGLLEKGYWDGDRFSCSVIEDEPYSTTIDAPYYIFSVSGGAGTFPDNPPPPSGATDVYVGESYSYSARTTDPDGDDVRYQFDWGDVYSPPERYTLTDFYHSGTDVNVSHTFGATNNYWIRVRAQDRDGYWSGWSNKVCVTAHPPPGGGPIGGCPTLFVWNGTDYAEEETLDIHAETDVIVQHEIENSLVSEKNVYRLRLVELDNFTSHVDQVELFAIDGYGETFGCRLIGAKHSEDGNVLYELMLSDDVRADTEPDECIDLTFLAPKGEINHFTFVIEGYNQKTVVDPPI